MLVWDTTCLLLCRYMVKETASGVGTAWLAWPRSLGALPKAPFTCPQHSLGDGAGACIVPRHLAGKLCHTMAGCTGISYTTDDAWNKKFPSACMLTTGPPIVSGPAGSVWDVRVWASHSKPNMTAAAAAGNETYIWSIPKSCSMELCALGSYGRDTQQKDPALEMPLVRRVLGAALQFTDVLGGSAAAEPARVAKWKDILEHLAPLPLTTTGAGEWVWAESNVSATAAFGVNQWYLLRIIFV